MVFVHKIMDEGILAGTPNATGDNMSSGDETPDGNGDIEDDED